MLHLWDVIFTANIYKVKREYTKAMQTIRDNSSPPGTVEDDDVNDARQIVNSTYWDLIGDEQKASEVILIDSVDAEKVDEAFVEHLKPVMDSFCQRREPGSNATYDNVWWSASRAYWNEVKSIFRQSDTLKSRYPSWDKKIDVIMNGDGCNGRTVLPLLTASVIPALAEEMKKSAEGLKEVSNVDMDARTRYLTCVVHCRS